MPAVLARPSPWFERHIHLIDSSAPVLDLACGRGRHTRWLQELGYPVVAVDIDLAGVRDMRTTPGVQLLQADLENGAWPFGRAGFGGILVSNYLHRPLLPALADALSQGGILLYDTFAIGQEQFGRPRNPDYLLQPNELRLTFQDRLEIVAFEEGIVHEPGPAVRQRICARHP